MFVNILDSLTRWCGRSGIGFAMMVGYSLNRRSITLPEYKSFLVILLFVKCRMFVSYFTRNHALFKYVNAPVVGNYELDCTSICP